MTIRPPTLNHIHLPRLTPYLRASALQTHHVRAHLDHKASPSSTPSPPPTLLTFQTPPTYTCGRRELGALTAAQISHLRRNGQAEFHEALRGGQTTFHGPGQLTAYLICDLKVHGLNSRSYIRLLELSVRGLLATEYGLETFTTEGTPGVFIRDGASGEEKKLCSMGVHLRRNVSSHGVGVNVFTDLGWFERIVACGLPGKMVTSVEWQVGSREFGGAVDKAMVIAQLADGLAREMAVRLEGREGRVEGSEVYTREKQRIGAGAVET